MIFTYILNLIFLLSSYNSAISNSIHHFCKCECEVNIFFLSDSHLIYCYYFFYQSVSTAQKKSMKKFILLFFHHIKYKKAQDFLCSFAVILYIEDVDLNANQKMYRNRFPLSSSTLRMWI